ncbi:tyrosine-type recombinase/integrase [Paracandidimonas soli]|uniref:tyrosine-type recombinase/integrase n=1 Tax=Paracandidimonas soli TaxID=1917182 RepID=UPI003610C4C1
MNRRKQRLALACPTLSEALTRYTAEVSSQKKGSAQERSIANVWRRTLLSGRRLNRITQADIQALRDRWLQDRAPATVTRRLALLSHVYTVAAKDWGIPGLQNPVALVRWPQTDNARDRRIFDRITHRGIPASECPRSELEWIIRCTRSRSLPTIVLLAVETGMRRSEIVGLTRQQVDMTTGVITLTETKNGRIRYVPLSPFAKDELRRHLADRPMRGRVFDVSASAVSQAFARAVNKSRRRYEAMCEQHSRKPRDHYFRDLHFHDLRHESASRLASVFQAADLAKVTGHRSTRMLLRYYHPHGRDLARKLARSTLGRRQAAILRASAT